MSESQDASSQGGTGGIDRETILQAFAILDTKGPFEDPDPAPQFQSAILPDAVNFPGAGPGQPTAVRPSSRTRIPQLQHPSHSIGAHARSRA